ncbi:MAG: hypothetical protein GVY16_11650 [Planctomycetes bacterium]|nr:hypothetical protein [Planctomycetota bacterium]
MIRPTIGEAPQAALQEMLRRHPADAGVIGLHAVDGLGGHGITAAEAHGRHLVPLSQIIRMRKGNDAIGLERLAVDRGEALQGHLDFPGAIGLGILGDPQDDLAVPFRLET